MFIPQGGQAGRSIRRHGVRTIAVFVCVVFTALWTLIY